MHLQKLIKQLSSFNLHHTTPDCLSNSKLQTLPQKLATVPLLSDAYVPPSNRIILAIQEFATTSFRMASEKLLLLSPLPRVLYLNVVHDSPTNYAPHTQPRSPISRMIDAPQKGRGPCLPEAHDRLRREPIARMQRCSSQLCTEESHLLAAMHHRDQSDGGTTVRQTLR